MPKITVHNGATNAREEDVSPASDASEPQDVAEDVLGLPTSGEEVADEDDTPAKDEGTEAEETVDYDGMTLAELREEASKREVPSYGSKAQIIERLKESDGEPEDEAE